MRLNAETNSTGNVPGVMEAMKLAVHGICPFIQDSVFPEFVKETWKEEEC